MLFEIPLLRLRALLARANGDEIGWQQLTQCCLTLAKQADYKGYLA